MSDTSRASSGVSLPMFVFLAKALPSINQYSRSPPAFGTTTSGLKILSASSMYSHVRSVSTTWASASITAMHRSSFPGPYPAYRLLSDFRLDQGEQFHSVDDYIAERIGRTALRRALENLYPGEPPSVIYRSGYVP